MKHHLIFEGAELSGKSWIMSQVYNFLEEKYHQDRNLLDGCYWFNCDVGIFGTAKGKPIIKNYLKIFKILKSRNIIIEKLFLADKIYNKMYRSRNIKYKNLEKKLAKLNFKTILIIFPEEKEILEQRIKDRLNLYPHYSRILKDYQFYIDQQHLYLEEIKKSKLPYLIIKAEKLPDENILLKILEWLGEK